ncbi:hypothetical protein PaeCFBP13512_22175 [Paenibacillus sp. CFBP13512]|uniref:hypothetical protein n=1 Tax=Paenibacillus sp. CFBP13512 TaxID=2184007 RepID=UPI0010C0D47E|nr:hypothetical protein [Paenibacillus sp. CFBP13512]TKJ83830.1 hypothetical protein PaeCFBP13512_22175 [Paenibacillus sp. CFBP13512]
MDTINRYFGYIIVPIIAGMGSSLLYLLWHIGDGFSVPPGWEVSIDTKIMPIYDYWDLRSKILGIIVFLITSFISFLMFRSNRKALQKRQNNSTQSRPLSKDYNPYKIVGTTGMGKSILTKSFTSEQRDRASLIMGHRAGDFSFKFSIINLIIDQVKKNTSFEIIISFKECSKEYYEQEIYPHIKSDFPDIKSEINFDHIYLYFAAEHNMNTPRNEV